MLTNIQTQSTIKARIEIVVRKLSGFQGRDARQPLQPLFFI